MHAQSAMDFRADLVALVDTYVSEKAQRACDWLGFPDIEAARADLAGTTLPWMLREGAAASLLVQVEALFKEIAELGSYAVGHHIPPIHVTRPNAHVRPVLAEALERLLGLKTTFRRSDAYGVDTLIVTGFVNDGWKRAAEADTPPRLIRKEMETAGCDRESAQRRVCDAREALRAAEEAVDALDRRVTGLQEWLASCEERAREPKRARKG